MKVTHLVSSFVTIFGLSTLAVSGQALLNEKFGEVSLGYKQLETGSVAGDVDLFSLQIHANAPYVQNERSGMDLFSTIFWDGDAQSGVTYYDAGFLAGGTLYYHLSGYVSPFLRGAFGYGWEKVSTETMTTREDGFIYEVGGGVEFLFNEDFSLTPEIKYRDKIDGEGSRMIYSIRAQYWVNQDWGVGANFAVDDATSGGFDATSFGVFLTFTY